MSESGHQSRGERQTFLVSENFYLRPVEPSDAMTASIWRSSRFPLPVPLLQEQLRKRLERGLHEEERHQLFIVCRRSDDRVVGSVESHMNGWRTAGVDMHVDPLMPAVWQDEVLAELVEIVSRWLILERNLMSVLIPLVDQQPAVARSVNRNRGHVALQRREFLLINGTRRDQLTHEFLNPVWTAALGEPPAPTFGESDQKVRTPAPPPVQLTESTRPPGAFACSERLYLRTLQPEDGRIPAEAAYEETEIVFPEGRWMLNPHAAGHEAIRLAESDPPQSIIFGIALRQTADLIGVISIQYIDWLHLTAETSMELFRKEHRETGFGTEAKHLALDYAFNNLGLHAVFSEVAETNPRSAAAVRKQGYREAGYAAWTSFAPGGLCGTWEFDLLASEWREARQH